MSNVFLAIGYSQKSLKKTIALDNNLSNVDIL